MESSEGEPSHRSFFRRSLAIAIAGITWLSIGSVRAPAGQSVNLAWYPSPSAERVTYLVRYGTSSGNYSEVLEAGSNTTVTVPDLLEGSTYYFVITAFSPASGLESDPSNELVYTVPSRTPSIDPPTLDALSDITIAEDSAPQTVLLSGIAAGSSGTSNQSLPNVTATSSNPGLIPHPAVTYNSPNAVGTIRFAPVANASGTARIAVTVDDGRAANNSVTRTFFVTVTEVNDPPTLGPLGPMSIVQGAGTQTVILSGITSGASNESQPLVVSATSSNTSLVQSPAVSYFSPDTTAVLTFAPVENAVGRASITVTVSDGQSANNLISRSFEVTIDPAAPSPIAFYLEAESGDLTNPMSIAASSGASNGSYVHSPANEKGAVSFDIEAAEAGNYLIWCRVLSAQSTSNSFYISVDRQREDICRTAPAGWSPDWHWSRIDNETAPGTAMILPLDVGSHTIRLRVRESSTLLDAVLITKLSSFAPVKLSMARSTQPNGWVNLSFPSVPGFRYAIEATVDMQSWNAIWTTDLTTGSGMLSHLDTSATASDRKFYRVRIQ